jgi:hypothetical protein
MKYAIVGSLTALFAGAGLALAQQPDEVLPQPRPTNAASSEVPADQAGIPGTAMPGFGGDVGGAPEGPPPPFLSPVCSSLSAPFRYWIGGEYHLWWLKENRFPPLLVGANANSIMPIPGGFTTTANVIQTFPANGGDLDRPLRNGGGMTLGGWVTDYQGLGIEGTWFLMEPGTRGFTSSGTGTPILLRPFFDVTTGQEEFLPVSIPTTSSGSVSGTAVGASQGIQCDSGRFAGAEVYFLGNLCCDCTSYRVDFLVGYRYLMLDDRFHMQTTTDVPAGSVGGTVTTISDNINTTNRYQSGEIGLRGEWHSDCWLIKGTLKAAFGDNTEGADLAGLTSVNSPITGTTVFNGGFLVRPSNSGSVSRDDFAIVPEADLSIGYQVGTWLRFTVGYSILYWSHVVRSGGQVNINLNPREVPALTPPNALTTFPSTPMLNCTTFWAQGLNAGLEIRF